MKKRALLLEIDEKAKEFITKKGTDSGYGARPLRRTIQTMVEDKIAEDIIEGNLKVGDKAIITEREEKISCGKNIGKMWIKIHILQILYIKECE